VKSNYENDAQQILYIIPLWLHQCIR